MAIIKQYHKDTDTTYFYESISYWDAEKGQARSKRRCIGKLDPQTGEMVPTGKRGRKSQKATQPPSGSDELMKLKCLYQDARQEIDALRGRLAEQEKQLSELRAQKARLSSSLLKIHALSGIEG